MKSPNLKNVDFKKLAVDHGEKAVVAVIALFVLFVLYSTRWMPYPRSPDELVVLADSAREKVEKRDWPAEERTKLVKDEAIAEKAKKMIEPIQSTPYAYRAPMYSPIFPPKQKNGEPKWLAPEHAVADAGQVPLFVAPPAPKIEPEPAGKAVAADDDAGVPAQFRKRPDAAGKAATPKRRGGGILQFGNSKDEDAESAKALEEANKRRAQEANAAEQRKREQKGRNRRGNRKDDDVAGGGPVGEGKTQGRRFVSVRAIIPINRQYMMLAKAFHEPVVEQMEATLNLLDYEVQRQKVKSDGTWSDWEPVDTSIAKEILVDSGGFDPEIVSPAVRDPTITMPLPPRAMGTWGKDVASHKDIENFELTEEQIEEYVQIQEKVMAAKEEQEKNKPKVESAPGVPQPKGWNDIQWNENKALKEMAKEAPKANAANDADKTREALIEDIKKKVKVDGQLILFRYFDFGVEPGFAYRYRVRVVYNNPNYNLGLDRVADPAFASGPVRPTDWSAPTDPVIVPYDSKQFLVNVSPAPAGKEPTAQIDIFQWHPDAGTTINAILPTKLGQFLGGKGKAPLLRPAEGTFEDTEVVFTTNEALVDVMENPKLNYEEHPDLGFTKPLRGGRIDLTNQALVIDKNGEFAVLDPVSSAEELANAKQMYDYQIGPYKEQLEASRKEKAEEKAQKADQKKGIIADANDERPNRRKNRPRNSSMKRSGGAKSAPAPNMQNPKPRPRSR